MRTGWYRPQIGKVTLKSNANEALSEVIFQKVI
jgi:hypothetical protein